MRVRTFVIMAGWSVLSLCAVADITIAQDLELQTRLEPCCGTPAPQAEGQGERKIRDRNADAIPERDRFKISVEIPIPSAGLGITTPEQAASADVRAILSRNGTPYAECFLAFDNNTDDDGSDDDANRAQYKVDVEELQVKSRALRRQRKGRCDIDLGAVDVQVGIPNVEAGDVVTATVVKDSGNRSLDVDFLDGVFERKP